MYSVNGNFFRATCAEVRKKGDTTVSNLSNIHFFYYDYYFYIFTPIDISRSPCMKEKSSSRLFPSRHIIVKIRRRGGASCFEFCTKIGLLFFRFRFDTVWILRDFVLFFIYCTCRNPNKTSSTVPHRPPARRSTAAFAVCCNTSCTHSSNIINLHTLILSLVYYIYHIYMCACIWYVLLWHLY